MRLLYGMTMVFALLLVSPLRAQQDVAVQRLHGAAARGDSITLASLLEHGVPVDARNAKGETALLLAVEGGSLLVADMLIQRGADINAQAANKDTPWLLAGAKGRTAMLELMLPRGPDYRLLNRFGGTALIPACHYGHPDTVRFLIARSKIDIDQANHLGWTCLLEAVILGQGGAAHQDIVRAVLEAGASPNIPDKDGITPLAHARKRGHEAIAALIGTAGGR